MSNDQKKIVSASAAEPLGAELERLLQPTRYFQHPRDVVRDPLFGRYQGKNRRRTDIAFL
jgi:hypothetical protein